MIALLLSIVMTDFERDQCAHFKSAIIEHIVAAEAGDPTAQQTLSLYEAACVGTNSRYICIDSPIPGKVLRCTEVENG